MSKRNTGNTQRAVVIGGGLSGLAAAWLLQEEARAAGLSLEVTLLEAKEQLGGKIGTIRDGGYTCEIGPNGFLDNKPFTLQLVGRMGMSDRLLRSNDNARKRFIFVDGRLQQLPEDPVSFLLSEMISIRGKLRIAAEYLVPPQSHAGNDETLGDFVRRRLGQEALEKLIDPMASGIFAGDPENMSLVACFPKIVHLEDTYGGLLKGMLALRKQAQALGAQGPASAGPGGVLMSFREGLAELIGGLRDRLAGPVLTGVEAGSVTRRDRGDETSWEVSFADGRPALAADVVCLAVPAYDAARLIGGTDPGLAATMSTIPYAAMGVVHLGFRQQDLHRPLDGFGFLVPHREGRRILGSLWASSIFAGRAPEGGTLLTVMMGGAKDPATPRLSEERLVEVAREEIGVTLGIAAAPVFSRVIKWEQAIPQYTYGHPDRVASLEKRAADQPGLLLTGNAFRGVGVNDCVASGMKVASEGVTYLKAHSGH